MTVITSPSSFAHTVAADSPALVSPTGAADIDAAHRTTTLPATALGRKAIQVGADLGAIVVGLALAYRLALPAADPLAASSSAHLRLSLLLLPLWPAVFHRYRLFSARAIHGRVDELGRAAHGVLLMCLLHVVAAFMFQQPVSRTWLLLSFPCVLALVALDRELTRAYFRHQRTQGRMLRPVVVVGGNAEAEAIVSMLRSQPALGYDVLGVTADAAPGALVPNGPQVLGPVDETVSVVKASGATTAIIATTAVDPATANVLARRLQDEGVHVEMSSGLRDIAAERLTVRALGRHPVFYLEPTVRNGWRAVAKRSFDVAVASTALLFLGPLLLGLAALVRLTSKGPALFRQERIGQDGRVFRVLKLRTMVIDAEARLAELRAQNEADGPLFKMKHDPRVTPLGRILRMLSLDELPQLWNVVRGDMSLVGPRPALAAEAAEWGPEVSQRLRVKPGITGMWQVSGRSDSSFDDYVRLDLYYVDNWTLMTDLTILAKTLPAVVMAKGAC